MLKEFHSLSVAIRLTGMAHCAGLVTFGGESKPWDWPEAVRGGEACKAMRAFAVLWQLIVLSPSMAEVKNTVSCRMRGYQLVARAAPYFSS
jgi:hypothetical protein